MPHSYYMKDEIMIISKQAIWIVYSITKLTQNTIKNVTLKGLTILYL